MNGYPQMTMPSYGQYNTGVNFVSSKAEVDSFELPPGGNAVFFDKVNDGMMYIRSRDRYNVYNTQVFEYKEIQPVQPESPYVTRTELEQMFQKFLGGVKDDTLRTNDEKPTATSEPASGGKH